MRYEHNLEVSKLERKHQNKTEELKKEHRRDVETVKSRYANHEGDLQELKDTQEQLEVKITLWLYVIERRQLLIKQSN